MTQHSTLIGYDISSNPRKELTWVKIGEFDSAQGPRIVSHGKIKVSPFGNFIKTGYRGICQPKDSSVNGSLEPFFGFVSAPCKVGDNIWLVHTIVSEDQLRTKVRWYRISESSMELKNWGEIADTSDEPKFGDFNASIASLGVDRYTLISCCRSGNYYTPSDPQDVDCGNISTYAFILHEKDNAVEVAQLRLQAGLVGDC